MELIVSFILSVAAGVVAYYICKWFDGEAQSVIILMAWSYHPKYEENKVDKSASNSLNPSFLEGLAPLCVRMCSCVAAFLSTFCTSSRSVFVS